MLRQGQRFELNGLKWRVAFVSPSRAHCVASEPRTVTVCDPKTGTTRTFEASSTRTIDISPNSCLELAEGGAR